jgi:hypothetical protein
MPVRHRILGWLAALVVMGAVFSLYLQPAFLFTLAQQVWSCF